MRDIRVHLDPALTGRALACGQRVELPAAAAQHLTRVLRLRDGATLTVFDGRGGEYAATLQLGLRGAAQVDVGEHRAIERESRVRIMLLQGLARGERMDWIIQKATELGVAAIMPIASQRSVVQLESERGDRRLQHWRAIALAACEQCGRNTPPTLEAARSLAEALACVAAEPLRLLLEPTAEQTLQDALSAPSGGPAGEVDEPRRVVLLVGPEGGWDPLELALAHAAGCRAVRLGPRVLRTETAGLAALVAVQCLAGDFT